MEVGSHEREWKLVAMNSSNFVPFLGKSARLHAGPSEVPAAAAAHQRTVPQSGSGHAEGEGCGARQAARVGHAARALLQSRGVHLAALNYSNLWMERKR